MSDTILFVCVHNGGRSVMAEAFFDQAKRGDVEAISAGTQPQERPHPEVVASMREVGIEVGDHRGRMLTDEMVSSARRVITMGCAVDTGSCPAILYANVEDWALPDPKGKTPEEVAAIRDEVRARVERLVAELAV